LILIAVTEAVYNDGDSDDDNSSNNSNTLCCDIAQLL